MYVFKKNDINGEHYLEQDGNVLYFDYYIEAQDFADRNNISREYITKYEPESQKELFDLKGLAWG